MPTTDQSSFNANSFNVSSPMTSDESSISNKLQRATLFRYFLLDNLPDGVVFVDTSRNIEVWNQSMELLTGLSAKKVENLEMTPSLIGLADSFGTPIDETYDPLSECMRSGKPKTGDYKISGRSGREIKVEMKVAPVMTSDGVCHGAIMLLHDSSIQLDLQRQLKDLYEFSMLDPLTQVANRAEFERSLDEFVRNSHSSDFECSLIICDIDFFKQINDNYNHHVGDQALVAFASLLKRFVRSQDVVARYGGEEFVILCANCDKDAAYERAEEIRKTLRKTPQSMLDGKYITASFGVSQLRPDESATEFFVRADTALLQAKEDGRNRVVIANHKQRPKSDTDINDNNLVEGVTWRQLQGQPLSCDQFRTRTPIPILVEKLRGYIIEIDADIETVDSNFASLNVDYEDPKVPGRRGRFIVELDFQELDEDEEGAQFGRRKYTYLRVTLREGRRSWFSTNANDLAPHVLNEIRRYFMIADEDSKLASIQPATEYKER